jgi:hypothetical protein
MKKQFLTLSAALAVLGSTQLQAGITAISDDFSTESNTFSNWTSVGITATLIQYKSTNVNDYDKFNLIPGDTTNKATGDGVKYDGSLIFKTQNAIPGDEAIALTLGGTMALGEQYNLTMGFFNDNSSYWNGKIQLYDSTANVVLAETENTPIRGYPDLRYVPLTWTLHYTALAGDVGHKLQIRVVENCNSKARDGFLDNFSLAVTPAP